MILFRKNVWLACNHNLKKENIFSAANMSSAISALSIGLMSLTGVLVVQDFRIKYFQK